MNTKLLPIETFQRSNKRCLSLRNPKIGFLNPKESENGFCVSLLNRLMQDLLDLGASREPSEESTPRVDSLILYRNFRKLNRSNKNVRFFKKTKIGGLNPN